MVNCLTCSISSHFLVLVDVLGFLSSVGLLVTGIVGIKQAVTDHVRTDLGDAYLLLSCYLIAGSALLLLAHVRHPSVFVHQFEFINNYFGRGLVQMLMGASVLFMASRNILPLIFGVMATALGGVAMVVSCPCFVVAGGPEQLKESSELSETVDEDSNPSESYGENGPSEEGGLYHYDEDSGDRVPRVDVSKEEDIESPFQRMDDEEDSSQSKKNVDEVRRASRQYGAVDDKKDLIPKRKVSLVPPESNPFGEDDDEEPSV